MVGCWLGISLNDKLILNKIYKAILWDNDGVLVETEQWYYEATKEIMQEEGVLLTLDTYRETFLKKNTGAWHLLKNDNKDYLKTLRKKRNNRYAEFLNNKSIFKNDFSNLLSNLGKRYRMGIVSSSRTDHFNIIHKSNKILKYFDFVITKDDFTKSKPNPEPYLLGINKSGYKDFECIAIEDSERGVLAAKRANLFCIAIPNEMTSDSDFSQADVILEDVEEIMLYLK